ncbi:MAG: FlgD immunoglobulin-like domain containing protein [Bacteroidota bacterium]
MKKYILFLAFFVFSLGSVNAQMTLRVSTPLLSGVLSDAGHYYADYFYTYDDTTQVMDMYDLITLQKTGSLTLPDFAYANYIFNDINKNSSREILVTYTDPQFNMTYLRLIEINDGTVVMEWKGDQTTYNAYVAMDNNKKILLFVESTSFAGGELSGGMEVYDLGLTGTTDMPLENRGIPGKFSLGQNYPNPFNPSTSIEYTVPEAGMTRINIYDATGRLVQTISRQDNQAGTYRVSWNGRDSSGRQVSSGVYFYQMANGSTSQVKKMMLIK